MSHLRSDCLQPLAVGPANPNPQTMAAGDARAARGQKEFALLSVVWQTRPNPLPTIALAQVLPQSRRQYRPSLERSPLPWWSIPPYISGTPRLLVRRRWGQARARSFVATAYRKAPWGWPASRPLGSGSIFIGSIGRSCIRW